MPGMPIRKNISGGMGERVIMGNVGYVSDNGELSSPVSFNSQMARGRPSFIISLVVEWREAFPKGSGPEEYWHTLYIEMALKGHQTP